jgi:hypothetical protein
MGLLSMSAYTLGAALDLYIGKTNGSPRLDSVSGGDVNL